MHIPVGYTHPDTLIGIWDLQVNAGSVSKRTIENVVERYYIAMIPAASLPEPCKGE